MNFLLASFLASGGVHGADPLEQTSEVKDLRRRIADLRHRAGDLDGKAQAGLNRFLSDYGDAFDKFETSELKALRQGYWAKTKQVREIADDAEKALRDQLPGLTGREEFKRFYSYVKKNLREAEKLRGQAYADWNGYRIRFQRRADLEVCQMGKLPPFDTLVPKFYGIRRDLREACVSARKPVSQWLVECEPDSASPVPRKPVQVGQMFVAKTAAEEPRETAAPSQQRRESQKLKSDGKPTPPAVRQLGEADLLKTLSEPLDRFVVEERKKSKTTKASKPQPKARTKPMKLRSRKELLGEIQKALKDFKSGRPHKLDFARHFLETEAREAKPTPSEDDGRRGREAFENVVRELKAQGLQGGDARRRMPDVARALHRFLMRYERGNARFMDCLAYAGCNCVGETKAYLAAVQALAMGESPEWKMGVMRSDDHVEFVFYNSKRDLTYYPLRAREKGEQFVEKGLPAPLFDPLILAKGYLDAQGGKAPLEDRDLMIHDKTKAGVPPPAAVARKNREALKTNSPLRFKKTGVLLARGEIPRSAILPMPGGLPPAENRHAPAIGGMDPSLQMRVIEAEGSVPPRSAADKKRRSFVERAPGEPASPENPDDVILEDGPGDGTLVDGGYSRLYEFRELRSDPGRHYLFFHRLQDYRAFYALRRASVEERRAFLRALDRENLDIMARSEGLRALRERLKKDPFEVLGDPQGVNREFSHWLWDLQDLSRLASSDGQADHPFIAGFSKELDAVAARMKKEPGRMVEIMARYGELPAWLHSIDLSLRRPSALEGHGIERAAIEAFLDPKETGFKLEVSRLAPASPKKEPKSLQDHDPSGKPTPAPAPEPPRAQRRPASAVRFRTAGKTLVDFRQFFNLWKHLAAFRGSTLLSKDGGAGVFRRWTPEFSAAYRLAFGQTCDLGRATVVVTHLEEIVRHRPKQGGPTVQGPWGPPIPKDLAVILRDHLSACDREYRTRGELRGKTDLDFAWNFSWRGVAAEGRPIGFDTPWDYLDYLNQQSL